MGCVAWLVSECASTARECAWEPACVGDWLCGLPGARSPGCTSLECALWARAVGVRTHLQPGVWLVAELAEILRLHPAAVRVQCMGSAQPAPGYLEVRSQGLI